MSITVIDVTEEKIVKESFPLLRRLKKEYRAPGDLPVIVLFRNETRGVALSHANQANVAVETSWANCFDECWEPCTVTIS